MKIAMISDAWLPQINGVVRALAATVEQLRARGNEVEMIHPGLFPSWPCPTYPEIRLAIGCGRAVRSLLDALDPDAIHIATEGPIGWAARGWCLKRRRRFTTSFHTRFPDYVAMRTGLPVHWVWPLMVRFHQPAERVFAATPRLSTELGRRAIGPTHLWPLGVDLRLFGPEGRGHVAMRDLPRPILLNVGRVAIEKNIKAFLDCPFPGSKVIVGEGPDRAALQHRHPEATFLGALQGEDLAAAYRSADVFVFPSLTDTLGLVNLEALASGVPVAAYPVAGPLDIMGIDGRGSHGGTGKIGAVDEDLAVAIRQALAADREAAANEARNYDWSACTDRFLDGLAADGSVQAKPALMAA